MSLTALSHSRRSLRALLTTAAQGAAAPEPGTLLLVGVGMAVMALHRRRRSEV